MVTHSFSFSFFFFVCWKNENISRSLSSSRIHVCQGGFHNHPSPVNGVNNELSRHEKHGHVNECMLCWIAGITVRQFFHRMISSSIHRFTRLFVLLHFVRVRITQRRQSHARNHVTSLGDLGLGGFAGLDSGLDS